MKLKDVKKEFSKYIVIKDPYVLDVIMANIIGNLLITREPIWTMFVAPSSGGKCLGKGTPVLMYDGTIKKVEEIIVGDILMGDDSKPRNVLSLARGKEEMFKIHQLNGSDYTVNKSHILSLKYTKTRKDYKDFKKHDVIDIPLSEFLLKNQNFKKSFRGYKVGVEFKNKHSLLVDPYFLGIWLGDGESASVRITNADNEVRSYLKKYAQSLGLFYKEYTQKNNKSVITSICRDSKKGKRGNNLQALLGKLNVLNNKHIPCIYKTSSRNDRLELLAGLIDSDGYLNEDKNIEFSNKNKTLCEDVVYLARSLGLRASLKSKIKTIKKNKFTGNYWAVYIGGNIHIIPTKIKRKKALNRIRKNAHLSTSIKTTSLGIGDYYGFTIDGNGRFLLGDFTVTHNTTFIAPCNVIPTIKFVDDMTEKTLLSAFKGKAGRETSLLRDIGPIGILAFSDFTAMLSKNPNSRSEILGQLRMVYDGEFTKRTGLGEIKWAGKMGFLGAATPEIYTVLEAGKAMGERFIYYWLTQPSDDEIAEKQKTVFISSREVTEIMKGFYREYCQSIRSYLEREGVPELIISEENRLIVRQASIFATNGKATVHTNFKTGQIDGLPNKAGIGRDYKMYETLLSALQAIECYETGDKNANTTTDHINIIKKCAYSSVNRERRKILEILAKSGSAMKTADIGFSDGLGLEKQSVELHLFPLHSVGLVSKHRSSQGFSWTISSEDMRQFILDAKNLIQDLPLPNAETSLEEFKEEEEEPVTEEDQAFLNF